MLLEKLGAAAPEERRGSSPEEPVLRAGHHGCAVHHGSSLEKLGSKADTRMRLGSQASAVWPCIAT